MPPWGALYLKTTNSLKSASKSKKKKSEGTAAEIIDIMKPGSDENIKLRDSVPVVELDKIDSIGRWKDVPPPDTLGLIVPAYAPDEETRATAKVLKTLEKQQLATGQHGSLNLSTSPDEAEYFEGGGGADEDCLKISEKADVQFTCLSCLHQSHLQVQS